MASEYSPGSSRFRYSREEALDHYCDTCGAMPGELCTYTLEGVGHFPETDPRFLSQSTYDKLARVGSSTKTPHVNRMSGSYWRMRRWLKKNGDILWS